MNVKFVNVVSEASDLPQTDVFFSLAGVENHPDFVETTVGNNIGANIREDVEAIQDDIFVNERRDATGADIVILLTDNANANQEIRGIARDINADEEDAFAIATLAAATGFTATHEIGHLIGCRHQRCRDCDNGGCSGGFSRANGLPIDNVVNGTIICQLNCLNNRVGNWSQVATGDTYSIIRPGSMPDWYVLRLTATDGAGNTTFYFIEVTKISCQQELSFEAPIQAQSGPLDCMVNITSYPFLFAQFSRSSKGPQL